MKWYALFDGMQFLGLVQRPRSPGRSVEFEGPFEGKVEAYRAALARVDAYRRTVAAARLEIVKAMRPGKGAK